MNKDRKLSAALFGIVSCSVALLTGCGATVNQAPRAATAPSASASTCIAIQRGGVGEVHDTRIAETWPDQNYGAQDVAFAGKVGGAAREVLLGFELPAIPKGSKI